MGIFFDKLWLIIATFIGVMIITSLLSLDFWICLVFASIFTIIILIFLTAQNKRRGNKISYHNFVTYSIIHGEDFVVSQLQQLNSNITQSAESNCLLVDDKPMFVWIKYSNISPDTVVKFCQTCAKNDWHCAYVLASVKDKKILSISRNLSNIELNFVDYKTVYNKLKNSENFVNIKPQKLPVKTLFTLILSSAFTRKHCKYFLFISLILLLLSFFTPLRIYYLTISSVCLLLALICVIKPKDSHNSKPF